MSANDVISLQLTPQKREYTTLAAVKAAFPDARLPHALPAGSVLKQALWQYPPKVVLKNSNGRLEVASVENDIAPTVLWGHIQLIFASEQGEFIVDQGAFAAFSDQGNRQFALAMRRILPSGRAGYTRTIQDAALPGGMTRVVGWNDGAYHVTVLSPSLSVDELAAIADSLE